jgi:hypothetical protein
MHQTAARSATCLSHSPVYGIIICMKGVDVMRRKTLYLLVIAAVSFPLAWTAPARSTESHPQIRRPILSIQTKGKRQRRLERIKLWAAGLTGDRLAVYLAYGMPSHRHFESKLGETTEVWTYHQQGKTLIFSNGVLSRTVTFTTWR